MRASDQPASTRSERGFTLIEIAIVLVLIGIIVGLAVKGMDLIESARVKKFQSDLYTWKMAIGYYSSRKNRLPGDSDNNRIMGDEPVPVPGSAEVFDMKLINPPPRNPIVAGSLRFWVYLGNNGGSPAKNLVIICASADCSETFNNSDGNLKYVESLDTISDKTADGKNGKVRAETDVTLFGTGNDRAVTSVAANEVKWNSEAAKAMVRYFRGN